MFYVCPPKRLQPTPLEPYLRQDPWFEGLIFLFARSDYLRFKRTIFRRLQPVWEKYKGDPGADQLCNLYKRRNRWDQGTADINVQGSPQSQWQPRRSTPVSPRVARLAAMIREPVRAHAPRIKSPPLPHNTHTPMCANALRRTDITPAIVHRPTLCLSVCLRRRAAEEARRHAAALRSARGTSVGTARTTRGVPRANRMIRRGTNRSFPASQRRWT